MRAKIFIVGGIGGISGISGIGGISKLYSGIRMARNY